MNIAGTPIVLVMAALLALGASLAEAQTSLDRILEPYLATYGLPALGAVVVKDGKIVAAGAVGTRKAGRHAGSTPSAGGK